MLTATSVNLNSSQGGQLGVMTDKEHSKDFMILSLQKIFRNEGDDALMPSNDGHVSQSGLRAAVGRNR